MPLKCSGSTGGSGDSDALPSTLTLSQAYSLLGLDEGASYDAVLNARNALLNRYRGQDDKKMEVELAYDIIFNSRLKARLSGDLPVSNKVSVGEGEGGYDFHLPTEEKLTLSYATRYTICRLGLPTLHQRKGKSLQHR